MNVRRGWGESETEERYLIAFNSLNRNVNANDLTYLLAR